MADPDIFCPHTTLPSSSFICSFELSLSPPVQLLHKLSVRAADGPQRLLRLIKNPVSDHLPPGCPRIATSFSAGEAVCPRTVVPEEGPAAVVVGAFAHGAASSLFEFLCYAIQGEGLFGLILWGFSTLITPVNFFIRLGWS